MRAQMRAEIVVRREEASGFRPAGNIVPFLRAETGPRRSAPVVAVDSASRPAPVERFSRARVALFLAVSLVLHAGVYAAFRHDPPPLASVGEKSISVEIVLGGQRVAGVAEKPTDAQETVNAVASQGEAPELVKPETARPELKAAEAATAVEAIREPEPARPVQASRVAEQAGPLEPLAETPPQVQAVIQPPPSPRKRPTVARRQKQDKGQDTRTRESTNSTASAASSGIGRGRSDAESNYLGLVRARLARNQHFPPDAKRNGHEGRAIVRFFIDASGEVSGIVLAQGTGVASLDNEAQAVVRRSSPFPPPPSGRRELFRMPLTFDIR